MRYEEFVALSQPKNDPSPRAGIIPYFVMDDGTIKMRFFISSDPSYGGSYPQIGKGHIDAGEDAQTAAVREGHEELGLQASNISKIANAGTYQIRGGRDTYPFTLFVAKIINPVAFSKPGFEARKAVWMSITDYKSYGRGDQMPLVISAYKFMLQN